MKSSIKRLFVAFIAVASIMAIGAIGASACTTIYTGANVMEEGTPFVARTEDYGSDMNKMFFIMDAGTYKAGETYVGCPEYGAFEWTWTHDSYRFTYFNNDFYEGVCPECGEKDVHDLSYTEFGTNEKGVSVSATETIRGNEALQGNWRTGTPGVDPSRTGADGEPAGIEETDIPTIILAEAATAREGLDILTGIYDTKGANGCNGLFICDQNETWYIENCSGTTYLAVKLNDDMIFFEPNMAVIGEIDLDDTENVVASDNLIAMAKKADTFAGNARKNIIDFRESYSSGLDTVDQRLIDGLNYINKDYNYTKEDLVEDNSLFTITNVKNNKIVDMYTNIEADRVLDKNDVFGYYKLSSVGKPSNQEIEIFQLFKDRPVETATVGWVGIGNMSNNVFVPYYPLLLTDIYEGCQKSLPTVTKTSDASQIPEDSFYINTGNARNPYVVFPEGWNESYYFTFEVLGDLVRYAETTLGNPVSAADKKFVLSELYDLQQDFINEFESMTDPSETTALGLDMSERAMSMGQDLIKYLVERNSKYPIFSDVNDDDWFKGYVDFVAKNGIMNGTSDTEFSPQKQTLREMFAAILYRMAGSPDVQSEAPFKDVAADQYYAKAAAWAYENDIIKGISSDKFGVGSDITREQIAVMLYRYAEFAGIDTSIGEDTNILSFDDADKIDSYAVEAMQWACGAGILNGDNNKLKPLASATRAEIAAMVTRFAQIDAPPTR